jgi:hypothetical protein
MHSSENQYRQLTSYLSRRFFKRNAALKRVVDISGRPFCPQNVEALNKALDDLAVAHTAATFETIRTAEDT